MECPGLWGLGIGDWGLGFGVWGLGFAVWGLEFSARAWAKGVGFLDPARPKRLGLRALSGLRGAERFREFSKP